MKRVVFACIHNAGRSQMAAAFFNALVDRSKAEALSAGTQPGANVHLEVVATMREVGIDLSGERPKRLDPEVTKDAHILVTMGCGDSCPHAPGLRREDWPIEDPKGRPPARVRAIRDEVRARVERLIRLEAWEGKTSDPMRRIS